MDEKCGCDICGEIPLEYELDSHHIRNALVKRGIRKWLLCDECIVIVDSFINNLQASRPNKIVDNWPTPKAIEAAGWPTAIERQARIDKKPKKSAYVRKADFTDLEERFWGFRGNVKKFMEGMKTTIDTIKLDIKTCRTKADNQYLELLEQIGDIKIILNDRK